MCDVSGTSLSTALSTALEHDIQLLKESMDILHETVYSQQESLHTLEDAIHTTRHETRLSQETLHSASSYSSGYYSIIGTIGAIALGILFII